MSDALNHKVNNLENFEISTKDLHSDVVLSNGHSAEDIITNLKSAIDNLKDNWKGLDAGVKIQQVVEVYNSMIRVRNALASLTEEASGVVSKYREIQIANGAPGVAEFERYNIDKRDELEEYTDTADTIDINANVNAAKEIIENAKDSLSTFLSDVKKIHDEMLTNWVDGPGRDVADSELEDFEQNVTKYTTNLADVSNEITNALNNYSA